MSGRISKYVNANSMTRQQLVWKCGIYLRLSREDGDKMESDSIANQRKIIDRFLEKNSDIEIYDIYTDDGYTGSNFDRPAIIRLMDDIKARKINWIIVKDLSRFGRNYHETGRYLEVVFPLLKLRFISVNDSIDSYKNPQSMKNSTVSFKNVMNDEYCKDISRKVRSSFNAKRRRGEYIGSFALYGYIKDPNDRHKLVIDEVAAENVRLIYKLFLDGMSIYNIALKLCELGIKNPTDYKLSNGMGSTHKTTFPTEYNGWSDDTIRRMLKNRMYIGDMVQGCSETISHKIRKCVRVDPDKYIIKEGAHEGIIDRETFEKVQARFQRDTWQQKGLNKTNRDGAGSGKPYVGYIKCADCGRAMQRNGYVKNGKSFIYFICGSYRQWKQCTRHALRVNKLDEIILTVIQKYVAIAVEMDTLLQSIKDAPMEDFTLTKLKKEMRSCEVERERVVKLQNDLYMDYKSDIITKEQYFHFKQKYADKIVELESRYNNLNEELMHSSIDDAGENSFVEAFKKYKNITTITRDVIVELIKMIYVERNGSLRIEFNFKDAFEDAVELLSSKIETGFKFDVELMDGVKVV